MKKLLISLSPTILICGSLVSLSASAIESSENLDFEKINASIASALSEIDRSGGPIEKFHYSINQEGTNVDEDTYSLDVELIISSTPWGGRLESNGTIEFSANLGDDNDKGLSLGVDAQLNTDTLAFLKYEAKKLSKCDKLKETGDLKEVLWKRHCEYVNKLPSVHSVSDLYQFLEEKISHHRTDVENYLASLQTELNALESSQHVALQSAQNLLKLEIDKTESTLRFVQEVELVPTKVGFKIKAPETSECPILALDGFSLEVSPDTLNMKGSIHLKFGKSLYTAARPVLLDILKGLQNGEAYALKFVQLDAEIFTNFLKNDLALAEGN